MAKLLPHFLDFDSCQVWELAASQVWASHFSFMKFRVGSSHAVCSECIKHKSLISGLQHHLLARGMQQRLLYAHLHAQFRDRLCYWKKRGCSRLRGLQLCMIVDGMDQGKFSLPRHPVMKSKQLDALNRPKLHVAACIAHGWAIHFYVSEPNLAKDSNTSTEVLCHTLSVLKDQGCDVCSASLTVQADNTVREVKNGMLLRWGASLVSDHRVRDITFSFLRSGHSHEDVDQCFGYAADWIRRKLPRAESSDDVVESLSDCLAKMDRPHEPIRRCYKLDGTRDWCLDLDRGFICNFGTRHHKAYIYFKPNSQSCSVILHC